MKIYLLDPLTKLLTFTTIYRKQTNRERWNSVAKGFKMSIEFFFKDSAEAIAYGRKHKDDNEAKKNLAVALIDNSLLRDRQTDTQKQFDYACNVQFIREALEVATGETIQ